MLKSKLSVFYKKVLKYAKNLNSAQSSKRFYLLQPFGKDRTKIQTKRSLTYIQNWPETFRNRMILGKQLITRKNNHLHQKFDFPKKSVLLPYERILRFFLEWFNVSHTDINSKSNIVWMSYIPQLFKHKRKLKNTWLKTKNDIIPSFSRGFKEDSGIISDDIFKDSKPRELHEPDYLSSEKLKGKEDVNNVFKRLAAQYNGTEEQNLYTRPRPRKDTDKALEKIEKDVSSNDILEVKSKKRSEFEGIELPPPQRCRLSCPLPPPGFEPPDLQKFQPNYQSPTVKFASRLDEIISPENKSAKSDDQPALKTFNRTTKTKKQPSKFSSPSSSGDLPSKMLRSRKIYPSNLKYFKSQLYQHQNNPEPKMSALIFEPDTLALSYDLVNAPTHIHKDEVVVQVIYSGVCGTDLFITEGKMPCGEGPIILGHEISGKVYAAGSEVQHVQTGDNVTVNPYSACGICRYCTRGLFSSCLNEGVHNAIGISKNGGWAEFVVVKKSQVYKVPPELGLDQAALIQPLSCVLSAESKLNFFNGQDILIQGLGLSGCLWASVLHSKGHKNVFVSDKSEKKKQQFQSLNLGYAFVPPEELAQYSADVVIECTGSPVSIEKSLRVLNPHGQMCFFGKPNPLTEIRCIPYDIVKKEITIVGNTGNAFCFSNAVDMASTMGYRYLDFDKLGVKVFELKDFREAFLLKKSGDFGKIMFRFEN